MKPILTALPLALLASAGLASETLMPHAGGQTWVLESLGGQPFEARATMTFPEAGRVAGDAPCNSYTGAMEADYPGFETGALVSTRRTCPDQRAEDRFLQALAEMRGITVLDNVLVLTAPNGDQLVFRAAE